MGWETSDVAATVGQGVPQPNPLQTIGNFANIQNQLNQNRLFQAQQMGGNALLQSATPQGGVDQNALIRNLQAGGPNAGLVAPEMLANGQLLQQSQLANSGTRIGAMKAALANIPPPNPTIPSDMERFNSQYAATLSAGAQQGLWTAQDAANATGGNIAGLSPAEVVRQAALQAGNATQVEQAVGKADLTSTGGVLTPTIKTIGPNGETVAPIAGASSIPLTLSPETEASRQNIVVGGVPSSVPTSALVTPTGQPKVTAGLTGPSGEVPTGFSPAGQAAGSLMGQGSAGQFVGLQQAADQAPAQRGMLGELMGIAKGEDFKPGPASDWTAQLGALAREFNIPFTEGSAKGTAAIETYRKIANQVAQAQFSALGGTGTDNQLTQARHTSPDNLLSGLGNEQIIPLLEGNADAVAFKNQLAQKWLGSGQGPETYGQFSTQFNEHFDPRVFQAQHMEPAERKAMLGAMSPAEREAYANAYRFALKYGGITP